jgi:hypothetical protein
MTISKRAQPADFFKTDAGYLDRPVELGRWAVPQSLRLDEGALVWSWAGERRLVRDGRGALERFIRLADAGDEQILTYARRWGTLEFCRHGLPCGFLAARWPSWHRPACPAWTRGSRADGLLWSPLAAWRHYARQAAAILRISRSLAQGSLGRAADWQALQEWGSEERLHIVRGAGWRIRVDQDGHVQGGTANAPGIPRAGNPKLKVPIAQEVIARWVNTWVQLAAITPALECGGQSARAVFKGNGLFAALAMHLLLAIGRGQPWTFCAGCGEIFSPRGSSGGGMRRFCQKPECKDAAGAFASRDYRQRQRMGRAGAVTVDSNGDSNPRGG